MRKVFIDDRIKGVADSYKTEMAKYKDGRIGALEKLNNSIFYGNLKDSSGKDVDQTILDKFKSYLSKLIEDYRNDRFVLMQPREFEDTHEEYKKELKDDELSMQVAFVGKKAIKPFWEWIFDKMGYKRYARELAFPTISKSLGIKACVYCNANFIITDKNNNGYYELDHWKPKSVYPFLSTSFYNLQPCCPHCNKRKSDDLGGEYMGLYEEDENKKDSLDLFEFSISKGSLVRYFAAQDISHIKVDFRAIKPDYEDLRKTADNKLGITGIYNEHIDFVEEMMWRAKFYDYTIIRSMSWYFSNRWRMIDIYRFKLGTYAKSDEIHKRPLTKFMQDIGKQLKIIKK